MKVGIHEVKAGKLGPESVWPRDNVIDMVNKGFKIVTVNHEGSEMSRSEGVVEVVRLDGETYLRVDGELIPRDDLGKLPEF